MSSIYIRHAQISDLKKIMNIISQAQAMLKADGSPQWQSGYPNIDTLKGDIMAQQCWVLMVDNQVAGTATLIVADDPNYREITDGSWKNTTDPYATIHRIAISSDYAGQHLGKFFISNLISQAYQNGIHNFRIDTHQLNKRMQHLATNSGYIHRGKIYVDEPAANHEDNARLAFELNL
ncbi:GNAT family N-acetyltransferase [Companilactobacillus crustorum]|uniref:GNAT family N-acetyltransferase n=1 Tax=Companilactobacillus crustorum TaxID=392416 RepID=UPI000EC97DA3|nr:GNAT family N-acetyltransferase [Companilactobacillus crustorum]WDT66663.1 GNAT family N-acetyltransferase [Companilactobacillus crustorum]HCD08659.1 GNAT family N-acetyltransferase [Lactobacillus sp.]